MVQGYTKQLKSILHASNWRFSRSGKGDHEIWTHPDRTAAIVVDNKIMSRHTANDILKQAGIRTKL